MSSLTTPLVLHPFRVSLCICEEREKKRGPLFAYVLVDNFDILYSNGYTRSPTYIPTLRSDNNFTALEKVCEIFTFFSLSRDQGRRRIINLRGLYFFPLVPH